MMASRGGFSHVSSPVRLASLAIAACVIGLAAISSLPPDEHEVLVVRTAQEMAERGDWIVPYFNGEPRLNKPPLNYWLTAAVAWASGDLPAVEVWHGRLVSWLAGIGILGLAAALGAQAYGRPMDGWFAALLTVTSAGWFSYTHDARPDLLYAFFCLAAVWSWWNAPQTLDRARLRWMLGMWLAFACATLSKGPQIPALLLVAIVLNESRNGAGSAWRRPRGLYWAAGLTLVACLTVPWWWAVNVSLPPEALGKSQLSGSLLQPGLEMLLNGYYLYRPLQLCLPWVPLVPLAWWFACTEQGAAGACSRRLLMLIAVVAAGLSFGNQQRYFYMLPVLPLMMLLAARGLGVMATARPRLALVLSAVQAAIAAAAGGWLFVSSGQSTAALLVAAVAGVVAACVYWRTRQAVAVPWALVLILTMAAFAGHAGGPPLWSTDRFNKHALAEQVVQHVSPAEVLVAFRLTPAVYVYETGRAIPRLERPAALAAAYEPVAPKCLYVLTEASNAETPAFVEMVTMKPESDDRAGLYCYKNQ